MMRLYTITIIAAGVLLGSSTAAQARPVLDPPFQGCGPGQSFTVYDWRTNGLVTHCTATVHVPATVPMLKKPPIWQFWKWTF